MEAEPMGPPLQMATVQENPYVTLTISKVHLAIVVIVLAVLLYTMYYEISNFKPDYGSYIEEKKGNYTPEEIVVAWNDMGMIGEAAKYDPLEYVANHNRVKETPTESYLWGVALAQPNYADVEVEM